MESSLQSGYKMAKRFENGHALTFLLILLALSTILDGLDSSIVTIVLPTISEELDVSIGDTSWVTLTYVVALAALLLPMAKIAKNGAVKRVFVIGIVIFTASSVACGISNNFIELTVFRLIQGVGAALMSAAVPVFITDFLPVDKKGLGMGVLGVASGLAVVLGPTIGGFVTDAFGWHWIFLINIPFGILAIIMSIWILPKDEGGDRSKNPDLINSIMTVLCIGAGIVCLQNLLDTEMSDIAMVACGIFALAFFSILYIRTSKHPELSLVSVNLLKRRDFQLITIAFTMSSMVIMGSLYVLPYFFQVYGRYSVSDSGLLLSLASVVTILISIPVGKWCDSRGCRIPSILAGVGRFTFSLTFIFVAIPDNLPLLLLGLIVMGCSMSFSGTALPTAMMHHAGPEEQTDASIFESEVYYLAASIGVLLYSIVFQMGMGSMTADEVSRNVLGNSFIATMIVGCLLSVIAILCAVRVKNIVPKMQEVNDS